MLPDEYLHNDGKHLYSKKRTGPGPLRQGWGIPGLVAI